MKLADFMFTVGYNGLEGVINRQTEQTGLSLSAKELIDQGFFKPGLCKALFEDDKEGVQYLIDKYNQVSGSHYRTEIQMMRLFGVFAVPDNVAKVRRL